VNSLIRFFLFCFLALPLRIHAAIWVAENSWNEEYEQKYSQWIRDEVTPQFFQNHQIPTDCADAIITLRWIFSRAHSLPMASSTGDGIVTNLTTTWDRFPTDQNWFNDRRFLEALRFINNNTNTRTLYSDLYPIELNAKNLRPGAIFIKTTESSGHAEWIARTQFDGINAPITFYSSTVPKQVRELLSYPFMRKHWPKQGQNGFGQFRWAVQTSRGVSLVSAQDMPGFSQEQFELSLILSPKIDFDDFIIKRLLGYPLDGIRRLNLLVSQLTRRFEDRVKIVEQGLQACQKGGCTPGTLIYYSHSTFSRDDAIQFIIIGITELVYSNRYDSIIDEELSGHLLFRWSHLQTQIKIDLGFTSVPLGQLVANWNEKKHQSDPNYSIPERWGL
jgi:hypothetical protein